ncbi:MAG TPA: hypothetical protein DEB17_11165 [Chlorobaculum sp.]|uniref:Uncharacterized protein n=1 Tax=Chlorobaculum tepidum (strain ATCC 49652 / DSM 12025 / NBRC 103806 / TLS) TaxID=194439 RepID=Q8KCM9_CHLTE|nr:hypothetical protein CT1385 [Chlorobaculum tepidum TLS]HBU24528.1 hypothetical protein [Chlorobaculum sp.]
MMEWSSNGSSGIDSDATALRDRQITANLLAIAILEPLFYFAVTFLITYSGHRKLHIFAAPAHKNELANAKIRPFCSQGNRRPG